MKNEYDVENIIKWMDSLTEFKTPDDIPEPPQLDPDDYFKYVVGNYIRCGAIPKQNLVYNGEYLGACRNSSMAIWKGDHFEYERYKCGSTYTDEINHFEDDDKHDLFVPIKLLKIHEEI